MHWSRPGYHYIIEQNGKVWQLLPEADVSNGVRGYNQNSVHVCYIGGLLKDDRSDAQKKSMIDLIKQLKRKYPAARIQGHRDFPGVTKKCPQFDAKTEYKWIS